MPAQEVASRPVKKRPPVLGRGNRYFSARIGAGLCRMLDTNFREYPQPVKTPSVHAFTSHRAPNTPFLGFQSPICGRYQLNADFFNTLTSSKHLDE